MKLWPTTTENKCFVKMLWHLLDECVKITVLLVCSICAHHHFFFIFSQSSICALFFTIFFLFGMSTIFTIFLYCSYSIFHCSSTVPFWLATLSFFFFFKVLISSYSTKRHYSYSSFFFFCLLFVLFFPFIYITVHPVFLRCTSTMPFCWATLSFYFYFFNFFLSFEQ